MTQPLCSQIHWNSLEGSCRPLWRLPFLLLSQLDKPKTHNPAARCPVIRKEALGPQIPTQYSQVCFVQTDSSLPPTTTQNQPASRPNSEFNSNPNTSSWTCEWRGLGKVRGLTVCLYPQNSYTSRTLPLPSSCLVTLCNYIFYTKKWKITQSLYSDHTLGCGFSVK